MEELLAYRVELLENLAVTIDKLGKISAKIPASQWNLEMNPVGYTPHFLLFHLCALESKFFTPQLPRILAEEIPTLPVFEEESWMADHYRPAEPTSAILGELGELRRQELAWLRGLSPAGWSRMARHPWWGLHALQWWVELQVDYSYQHVRQLSSIIEV